MLELHSAVPMCPAELALLQGLNSCDVQIDGVGKENGGIPISMLHQP